ncbi:hypothetical protein [Treponema pedis]|uniref:hypothetical protein n=1 Tax=Treponema pedis TaxID=409322 RepID=UPI00197D65B3|nr:hypothetical protein [Treponema pedis]QSI05722.1 hypothetical protein DYQ05_12820 [Treponema pedis]
MKRRKRFILAVCISAVLTISIAGCNGNGINSKKDSAVVTPGKSGTDTSPEKPSELLNTVWEVTEYLGQGYPKDGTHLYIYIGPDGQIYDAKAEKGGDLKRTDDPVALFAGWTLKNGNFYFNNRKYSHTEEGDTLVVGDEHSGFKAKKTTDYTGDAIKKVNE